MFACKTVAKIVKVHCNLRLVDNRLCQALHRLVIRRQIEFVQNQLEFRTFMNFSELYFFLNIIELL